MLKKVYEFLEKTEEGKAMLAILKEDVETFKDADAKARLAEKEKNKLVKELEALKPLKEKLEAAGIDVDDIENLKKGYEGKTELEKQIQQLTKQINTITKSLENEKSEKERIEKQSKSDKLKSEFGSSLKDVFGKMGDVIAENMISRGSLKFDDKGQIIYETPEGVYTKSDAIEMLKVEYKDHIVTRNSGSNFTPPKHNLPVGPDGKVDYSKMSAQNLLLAGLNKQSTGA